MSNTPSALTLRTLAQYADNSATYQAMSAAVVATVTEVRSSVLGQLKDAILTGSTPTALYCPTGEIVRRQLDSIAPHCADHELDEIGDDLLLIARDEFQRVGQRIRPLTGSLLSD